MQRKRLVVDAALLVSILFLPWWISVAAGAVGLLMISNFFEVIIFMFLIDLLYGASGVNFWSYPFLLTSAAIVALLAVGQAKRWLRI